MGGNKGFRVPVETDINRGNQGNGASYCKDQIQGENITHEAIDYGRQGTAACADCLNESHNSTPVFLRQCQHHCGIEYGVAHAVAKAAQEEKCTQQPIDVAKESEYKEKGL